MQETAPRDREPSGVSGVRVVAVILGSLALLVAVVLIVFTLFDPESAPCASGELATNVRLPDGGYEPRIEQFETIEEAEAFICRDVPELQAEGWTLDRIQAERTVPIELLVEGRGIGVVTLGYVEGATGRPLTIDSAPFFGTSYFRSQVPGQASEEEVEVRENAGTLYRFGINPFFVTLIWREGTLEHRASVQLTPDFEVEELVQVLETLE